MLEVKTPNVFPGGTNKALKHTPIHRVPRYLIRGFTWKWEKHHKTI